MKCNIMKIIDELKEKEMINAKGNTIGNIVM
jgi:hypothetical protein